MGTVSRVLFLGPTLMYENLYIIKFYNEGMATPV